MLEIFTVVAVVVGAVLFLAGSVGLLRFPDGLTRLHALTKIDNLGLGLVIAGLIPHYEWLLAAKLLCLWLLVQLSGAIVTQLIAGVLHRSETQR